MSLILGIDAAWTVKNPSGIALVSVETDPPRLIRASPSFEDFVIGTTPETWCSKHEFRASLPDVLSKAGEIGSGHVTVMAVDMPLALQPIRSRRCCDNAVSRAFGAQGCSTHSPTELRPGTVADKFLKDATAAGFTLQTRPTNRKEVRSVLEVYPHVALLELCKADFRLPYKLSRRRKNWATLVPADRLARLNAEWVKILACLGRHIELNLKIDLLGKRLQQWKAWEDVIDAIICCWVGTEWLAGRAQPYGDDDAAIWVPQNSVRATNELA